MTTNINRTAEQQDAAIARFAFDRPPVDLRALYMRFEKDTRFHGVAQSVNSGMSFLSVDEVLRVAERLDEVLRERL